MVANLAKQKKAMSGWIRNRTSPYQFYQFWLNASDADAEKWIKIFTFLPKTEIDSMIEKHRENPGNRSLQKALAREVTIFVHGESEYDKAIETTEKLFADMTAPATALSEEDIATMEGVVRFDYPIESIRAGADLIGFLAETKIFPSKGEARKMIQNGGISINRVKVQDITQQLTGNDLLHGKYILVQKGKKHYYLVNGI